MASGESDMAITDPYAVTLSLAAAAFAALAYAMGEDYRVEELWEMAKGERLPSTPADAIEQMKGWIVKLG